MVHLPPKVGTLVHTPAGRWDDDDNENDNEDCFLPRIVPGVPTQILSIHHQSHGRDIDINVRVNAKRKIVIIHGDGWLYHWPHALVRLRTLGRLSSSHLLAQLIVPHPTIQFRGASCGHALRLKTTMLLLELPFCIMAQGGRRKKAFQFPIYMFIHSASRGSTEASDLYYMMMTDETSCLLDC